MQEKWGKLVLFLAWLYSKTDEKGSRQDKGEGIYRFACPRHVQQS